MATKAASNADLLRAAVASAEAEGKDLTLASERRRIVDTVAAQHKTLKPASLQAALSDLLKKNAKAKGQDPARFAKKPAAQYASSLKSSKAPGPVDTAGADARAGQPASTGQIVQGRPAGPMAVGPVQGGPPGAVPLQATMNEKQLAEALNGLWEGIRMADENIEPLTQDEKESLGAVWLPFAADLLASRNRLLLLALVSTVGIGARKIKRGRAITRKQKAEAKARAEAKAKAEALAAGQPVRQIAEAGAPSAPAPAGTAQVYRPEPGEAGIDLPPGVTMIGSQKMR